MGQEEQSLKSESRSGDVGAQLAAFISATVFLVATWYITLNAHVPGPFPLHPMLQSLGIVLFSYGIITLQPTSQPKTKADGLNRHQISAIAGFISFFLGVAAMIYNKTLNGSPHFTTWHGIIGIMCIGWMCMQVLFGAASVWFNGRLLGGNAKARALWKYHRLSGYILFPTLLLSSHLGGAWSTWAVGNSLPAVRVLAFTMAPLILLVSVYSRIRTSKMRLF